jgi:UDP-galactopyranose mutase
VSTSIRDVVRPYGEKSLVRIADTPAAFVAAAEAAMREDTAARLAAVDAFLTQTSWDRTWARMAELIESIVAARSAPALPGPSLQRAATMKTTPAMLAPAPARK